MNLTDYIDFSTFLFSWVVFLLSSFTFLRYWTRATERLPPGPNGIFSSLRFITNGNAAVEAAGIAEKNGTVCSSLSLGKQRIIIISDPDAMKEAFLKTDVFVDRPLGSFFIQSFLGIDGVASSCGETWKVQRRFSLSVLRDFGMGKLAMEQRIHVEAKELLREFDKITGTSQEISPIIGKAIANIIWSVAFGRRFAYDDQTLTDMLTNITYLVDNLSSAQLATDMVPLFQYLPGDPFGVYKLKKARAVIFRYLRKEIDDCKLKFDGANITCFIDSYLEEAKKRQDEEPAIFDDAHARAVAFDLFFAGTGTGVHTLRWALGFLIMNPEIQTKVQEEIDHFVGNDRLPKYADSHHMVFTEAVVLEIQRAASIAPLGVPHCNLSSDVEFRGFKIPRGSAVLANLYWAHYNPKLWPNPDVFDPYNFIDRETGKIKNRDRLMPFSIGRRSCIGESMAKVEIFILIVSMLQKFSFSFPDGATPPDIKPPIYPIVTARLPSNFNVVMARRE